METTENPHDPRIVELRRRAVVTVEIGTRAIEQVQHILNFGFPASHLARLGGGTDTDRIFSLGGGLSRPELGQVFENLHQLIFMPLVREMLTSSIKALQSLDPGQGSPHGMASKLDVGNTVIPYEDFPKHVRRAMMASVFTELYYKVEAAKNNLADNVALLGERSSDDPIPEIEQKFLLRPRYFAIALWALDYFRDDAGACLELLLKKQPGEAMAKRAGWVAVTNELAKDGVKPLEPFAISGKDYYARALRMGLKPKIPKL